MTNIISIKNIKRITRLSENYVQYKLLKKLDLEIEKINGQWYVNETQFYNKYSQYAKKESRGRKKKVI